MTLLFLHKLVLSFVVGSIVSAANAASTEAGPAENAQLTWIPHSTSYQPWTQGPMSRIGGSRAPVPLQRYVSEPADVHSAYSVARKMDAALLSVLGKTTHYENFFDTQRYDASKLYWRGFCHQWSAGSQDQFLTQAIDHSQGLICGHIYFSLGDLREIVTAFYPDRAHEHYGLSIQHPTAETIKVRSATGADPLDAEIFHSKLLQALKANRGAVINIGNFGEVWNFPLYVVKNEFEEVPVSEQLEIDQLPADFYQGNDRLLQALQMIDQALKTYVVTDEAGDADARLAKIKKAQRAIQYLNLNLPMTGGDLVLAQGLLDARLKLVAIIRQQINAGQMQFNPDYKIRYMYTLVTYARESRFSSGRDISGQSEFETYLLENQRTGVTTGLWISEPADRPTTLWFPEWQGSRLRKNPYQAVMGLNDLYDLLQDCTSVSQLH